MPRRAAVFTALTSIVRCFAITSPRTSLSLIASSVHSSPSTTLPLRMASTTTNKNVNNNDLSDNTINAIQQIEEIISQDEGGRGMKHLVVKGDLLQASLILGRLPVNSHVLVLSGFPCCVTQTPPTETDGPPGAVALAMVAVGMGHRATIVTDDCNRAVFAAAITTSVPTAALECFPPEPLSDADEKRLRSLQESSTVVLACERAGPAKNGVCHTMRGIDMNEKGLIAPLHRLVQKDKPFLAVGDGGNELGMGKVLRQVETHIPNGEKIGCAVAADWLVAASVSNWGGYALAAGAAIVWTADRRKDSDGSQSGSVLDILPTEQGEIDLLQRCVDVGCRDGVSGKVEATVDGMPLETSLECLRKIREVASKANS